MTAKPKKKKSARSPEGNFPGYVSTSFRWEDVLTAMPPAKKPGASSDIPNPLDKKQP